MYILVTGSLLEGIALTGPFASKEAAAEHGQAHFERWDVAFLNAPLEDRGDSDQE